MSRADRSYTGLGHWWWPASVLLHAVLLLVVFTGRDTTAVGRAGAQIIEVSLIERPGGGEPNGFEEERDRRQPKPPRRVERNEAVRVMNPVRPIVAVARRDGRSLRTEDAILVQPSELPAIALTGAREGAEAQSTGQGAENSSSHPSAGGGAGEQVAGDDIYSQLVDTASVLRQIEAAKRYPALARKMGLEGTTVVRFRLEPSGQVESLEVAESSGSEILDRASLETVRRAAPLPYVDGWQKVEIVFKLF